MDPLAKARAEVEALRSVSAAPEGGGVRNRLSQAAEPLARAQRAFNDALPRMVDALPERVDDTAACAGEAERRSRELEERLLRLERRGGEGGPRTVAAQPRQDAMPTTSPSSRGCGRRRRRCASGSVPTSSCSQDAGRCSTSGAGAASCSSCCAMPGSRRAGSMPTGTWSRLPGAQGVEAEQADVLAALEGVEAGALGAVTALQLVEHLPPAALIRLLELAASRLRPGAVLVLETIHPVSPQALRNYFADLTHAQPLVAETLGLLVRGAGRPEVEVRFLNAPAAGLREVELPAGAEWDAARSALAANRRLLGETLFAPLDYAIVARLGDN